MSHATKDGGLDVFSLSDRSLYRWIEQQDSGWQELPDDAEFTRMEKQNARNRFARISRRIHAFIPKRRRYAPAAQ